MNQVRSFNESGLRAFEEYISLRRNGLLQVVAEDLLNDTSLTESLMVNVEIQPREFATRRSAAEYLHKQLADIPAEQLRKDAGLWSWLSLYYFNQVCPEIEGERKIRNDYTYIFKPDESRYYYRHLLFIAWNVFHVAPKHNRLFLDQSLYRLDKYTSEVFKRLYLTRVPCIFEVLERLYWDETTNAPRKRMVSPGKIIAGNLMHRFPTRIRQLEKTYDLLSLTSSQLIELLGQEFKQHIEAG
jgi:hypothetical protein